MKPTAAIVAAREDSMVILRGMIGSENLLDAAGENDSRHELVNQSCCLTVSCFAPHQSVDDEPGQAKIGVQGGAELLMQYVRVVSDVSSPSLATRILPRDKRPLLLPVSKL